MVADEVSSLKKPIPFSKKRGVNKKTVAAVQDADVVGSEALKAGNYYTKHKVLLFINECK